MHFLDILLPLTGCTIGGIIYENVRHRPIVPKVGLLPVLGVELLAFISWLLYWTWLYPAYFTPFRHLATPKKRTLLRGNRDEFLPANAWHALNKIARTTPNDGMIRYYGALCLEKVLLTSPEAMRDALNTHASDIEPGSVIKLATKRFTGGRYTDFNSAEIKIHKKYIGPAFTVPHAKELAPTIFSTAVRLVHAIERKRQAQGPGVPIPLHDFAARASLDSIGIAGMGYDFNAIDDPEGEDFALFKKITIPQSALFNWLEWMSHSINFKWLISLPIPKNLEVLRGAQAFRRLTTRVIDSKKAKLVSGKCTEDEKRDIVSVALASGNLEPVVMVDYMTMYIQAGQESNTAMFCWVLWELGRRPEMQQRLRKEIRDMLSPSLEDAGGGNISDLPYLNAVCNETLRVHPMMPVLTKEAVRDTTYCGERIPRGTCISYSAYVTNRDPKLWGPRADEFDPERWMQPGTSRSGGATTNYAMLTFGHGPRSCIGQNIARVTLPCFVASVVGRYHVELTPESAEGKVQLGLKNVLEGLNARLTPIDGW
ncbi:cytochrome p450 domain-containing protein [Sarocladium implicatum]|nr:cytochrome p450 domain-containing protein [Sarocladium implicatum]